MEGIAMKIFTSLMIVIALFSGCTQLRGAKVGKLGVARGVASMNTEKIAKECEQGDAKKCVFLGLNYHLFSPDQAEYFYSKACELDQDMCYFYGVFQEERKEDMDEALKYFKMSCQSKVVNSGCTNATLNESENGNHCEAIRLYKIGCEGDEDEVMSNCESLKELIEESFEQCEGRTAGAKVIRRGDRVPL